MVVEAPISKFKKTNLKIYIGACIVLAVIFAYDGYLSKYEWSGRRSFYDKHVKEGKVDETMLFNRISPFFLLAVGGAFMFQLRRLKVKTIIAGEKELIIESKETIAYDSIQKIDKTAFESKGFFVITYKDKNGAETGRKISDRRYDNLSAVLDKLIEEIS